MLRTHTCGQLNEGAVGTTVTLCGWVGGRRDHGSLIFIDVRDGYGLTQVVFRGVVVEIADIDSEHAQAPGDGDRDPNGPPSIPERAGEVKIGARDEVTE